eukprot:9484050-Pyramimonas_sp.AAC.1
MAQHPHRHCRAIEYPHRYHRRVAIHKRARRARDHARARTRTYSRRTHAHAHTHTRTHSTHMYFFMRNIHIGHRVAPFRLQDGRLRPWRARRQGPCTRNAFHAYARVKLGALVRSRINARAH